MATGSFKWFKQYVSEVLFYNGDSVNVLTATPQINFTSIGTGSYSIGLSNDDGVTWENASNNVEHTFSSVGHKLRLKIVGRGVTVGCSLGSDGKTYTPAIRVDYTTN